MPLHDWTRVVPDLFHDFHRGWTVRLAEALNGGLLPAGVSALLERRRDTSAPPRSVIEGGSSEPPAAKIVRRNIANHYAGRADQIVVRHHLRRILAVIEIVSPGNKDSRAALRDFVEKTIEFLRSGVHVLVIDLFPPTPRDPFGIHKVIWDEFEEEPFALEDGKDRILASYETGGERAAYIEPVGVGDALPDMPLFLANFLHINVPLEPTYMATWEASPEEFRMAVETGVLPATE